MGNTTLRNIAIVGGIVLFVPAFVIDPALGVVFAVILLLGFIVAQRTIGTSEVRTKKDNVDDLLNRMWIPVRDELSEVVRRGGSVTSATSVWTSVPNLYKQETPATFHQGMERYVNQRAQAAALVASVTATEESRQQQEIEQQKLLFMSRELLEEARKAINFIPGSEAAVRRAEAARPSPSATRPSAGSTVGTAPAAPASRSAQAQTATPARTISWRPEPSRPAPASMRSSETARMPSLPKPPSRPAPTPLRISDTPRTPEPAVAPPTPPEPMPSAPPSVPPVPSPITASAPEPAVAAPAPPEPQVPPSVPPVPSPSTASAPEPAEAIMPPEPAVTAPAPREPEPASTPNEPPGDLRLDVASVCEALFDPKIMSYEANRLFDDLYKDATVRWKGTTRRANVYSYDFNFGDGGGTKAEFDVYEVKQQYGSRTVKAFVQLPEDAAADLGARIGEDVQFEGRLISCEGSARRLYVLDARMVS